MASGITRREALKRGAAIAGAVWAVPTIQVLNMAPAGASGGDGTGTRTNTKTSTGEAHPSPNGGTGSSTRTDAAANRRIG